MVQFRKMPTINTDNEPISTRSPGNHGIEESKESNKSRETKESKDSFGTRLCLPSDRPCLIYGHPTPRRAFDLPQLPIKPSLPALTSLLRTHGLMHRREIGGELVEGVKDGGNKRKRRNLSLRRSRVTVFEEEDVNVKSER